MVLHPAQQPEAHRHLALPALGKSCPPIQCGLVHQAMALVIHLVEAALRNNLPRRKVSPELVRGWRRLE